MNADVRVSLCTVAIAAGLVVMAMASGVAGWGGVRVAFESDDGVRLEAMLYEPFGASRGGVVLVHMLTRDRHDWDRVGERFAAQGMAALAIDLRGHGASGGVRAADPAEYARDVSAALDYLAARPDIAGDRLGIAGASLGANLAVTVAAGRDRVASIALLSPTLDYRGLRIEGAMKRYGARPALLVASTDDGYATRSVKTLAAVGPGVREVVSLDYAGHGTVMLMRHPDLSTTLVEWFARTLL